MAALADFETHFNVDRRRVILGGYSSGGDLAYRTGFRHSSTFAGLLIENSSPFRDTESSAGRIARRGDDEVPHRPPRPRGGRNLPARPKSKPRSPR